ncbi:unnamed protein product [Arctogadus glacialis]
MLLSHSKATDGGLHTGPRRHEHCSQGCWSQCLGSQRPERLKNKVQSEKSDLCFISE